MNKWTKRKRRFHKDTYPGTPWNRGDFVLWHGCGENDVCWDTEIGRGRPAWNLQDAAIVTEHLGYQVDVACGGIDNLVRHHDYTIAVSEAISGQQFAKYWLHGGHLFVKGQKMSKSKGNVVYPDDLEAKGYKGDCARFFLIYGHYRKRLNFTWDRVAATSQKLDQFKSMVQNWKKRAKAHASSGEAKRLVEKIVPTFEDNMNCDLDVKAAFDALFTIIEKLHRLNREKCLGGEDAEAALTALERVDRVLRVIF
jgi:cysteinyl-tRNA synthetase